MSNKITILRVDDWECLYVNGVEKHQSEGITISDILPFLNGAVEIVDASEKMSEYVSEYGRFPEMFLNIK